MVEKYTLEEWLGMLEEAGYNISEQDPPAKPSTTTTPSRRDRFGPQSARDIADRDAATDAYRSGAVSPGASSINQAASDIAGTRFPPTSLGAIASTLARTARGGGLAPKAAEPRYRGPSDEPNRPGETPGQRLDRDLRAAARDPGGAAHRATVAAMTAAERPRISADAEREAGKRMQHVRAINRALTPGVINRARDLGLPVPGFDALPVTAADSGNVARRLTQQGIDSTANAIQQRLSRLKEQDDKKNPYPRRIPDWQRDALLNDPEGTAADQALSTPSLDALDGAMRNVRTMNAMRRAAINSANADVLAGVGTDDGYSNRLRRALANKIDLQNRLADRAAALKAAGRDADELPRVANPIEPWDVPRGLKKAPQIPDVPNSPINEDEKSSTKKTPYPRPISPTDSSTMVAGAGTNAASVAQRIGYQNTMNRMQSALKAAGKPHRLDFAYEPIPENNYEEPFGENNMKEDTRRTDTLRGAVTSPTTPRPTFSKQGTGGPGSRPTSPTADYGRPHSSRYQSSPVKDTAQMEETYTLEEWIGMVEEAGYSIAEQQPTRGITASPTAKPIVITAPAGPTRNVGGATPTATGRRRTGRTTPRRSPSQAELDQAADAAANQLYSLGSRTQPPRAVRPPASAPQPPETPGDILNRGLANTQQLTARAANAIGDLNTVRSKVGLGPGVTPDDSSKTVAAIDSIGTDRAVRSALNAPRTGIQQVTPAKQSPKNEQTVSLNESTVARLQSLAGIKPVE